MLAFFYLKPKEVFRKVIQNFVPRWWETVIEVDGKNIESVSLISSYTEIILTLLMGWPYIYTYACKHMSTDFKDFLIILFIFLGVLLDHTSAYEMKTI